MKRLVRASLCLAIALVLAGCGGGGGADDAGGGGGVVTPPAGNFALSGTISVSENAAVDSDLNDVLQQDYAVNDSRQLAQALTSPVLLVGTVNIAGTGPAGTNKGPGDPEDYFRLDLVAGQVVELEFAADPLQSDVDLYIVDLAGNDVGVSNGSDTRYECVTITNSGTYYVNVSAFLDASIYNLRIGAPGTAGSCAASTTAARFVPDQLIAMPRAMTTAQAKSHAGRLAAARVTSLSAEGSAGPQLLQLPATAQARASGLQALGEGRARAQSATRATAAAAVADLPPALAMLRYAKRLRATGAYLYVEPNWIMERHAAPVGSYPPADRGYPYQRWHYEQIELPAAMNRIAGLATQPAQRPIAAIIDDGVVLDHPDLAAQIVPGSSGRSFISFNSAGDGNTASGDNPSTAADQPIFHGTHVSGTVAAATFDAIGGAGVAPMAQIMPLRVFAPGRGAASIDVINAMFYAAGLANNSGTTPARRADVINMSLGSDRVCDASYQDAINRVRAAGVVVVVSAGNSGRNDLGRRTPVGAPANCAGAIAVSATEAHKQITFYSNTGAYTNYAGVTVAAPGGDTGQSTSGSGAPDGVFSDVATFDAVNKRQPAFGPMQGTSMAAPHVTGVIALMRYVNPALSVTRIDQLITSGAITDDLGTAGNDIDYGRGLINARKAVEAALQETTTPPPAPPGQVVASPTSIDFGSFQTTAVFDLAVNGSTTERVVSVTSSGGVTVVPPAAGIGLGRYTVNVDRNQLATGSNFPTITVTLTPNRTITLQLSVLKPAAGAVSGNFGPMYVLLVEPGTLKVLDTVLAQPSPAGYTWRKSGFTAKRVSIIAGGDLDNDDLICAQGEPCGAFPVLPAGQDLAVIELNGDRTDLNFQAAPLSGISVQSLGTQAGPRWSRRAVPMTVSPVPAAPRAPAARHADLR